MPPILTCPKVNAPLILYLAVSEKALSFMLVQDEEGEGEKPFNFVSIALNRVELRCHKIERLVLTYVVTTRKLRHYFHGPSLTFKTCYPIRQMLNKPDLVERMVTWAIELSKYDMEYVLRTSIKLQVLADFLVEPSGHTPHEATWVLYRGWFVKPKMEWSRSCA